jgi:hypothetical protein
MSYQVEYEVRPGYLYVRVSGERTLAAVVALTAELGLKAVVERHRRLLVDIRDLAGWLKTMESYELVTREFPRLGRKGILKAAIVDRAFPEPNQRSFLETVAVNRGFGVRVMTDLEAAIAWLLEGPDPAR